MCIRDRREANRLFGYTAKQTLDLAQALYEKRLLTYPRTDSSYLTDDMGDTAAGIIKLLCVKFSFMAGKDFTPELGKVLNSKKVSDHHAIIPTMELAKTDITTLPESERNILTLVGARLLMATAAPHTFEAVTAVFECTGQSFTAKGKTILCEGWKEIDRKYRAALKNKHETDDADSDTEKTLPPFTEGQTFDNPAATVTEHDTIPPKPHNEASLLSAMERAGSEDTDPDAERKGLGTPATRAAVIEKLVKGGFCLLYTSSREVENIFENSDFVLMLNQAQGDRTILAKQLNISPQQMKYVTHTEAGEGLIFYGNVVLPFVDRFPKDTELYRVMTTKPEEVSESGK